MFETFTYFFYIFLSQNAINIYTMLTETSSLIFGQALWSGTHPLLLIIIYISLSNENENINTSKLRSTSALLSSYLMTSLLLKSL